MPVTILARTPDQCAWPCGEAADGVQRFCGAPVLPGGLAPYCPEHHALAYRPAPSPTLDQHAAEHSLSRLHTHAGRPWDLLRFLEPA